MSDSKSEPEPYTTFEGEIANELRTIYAILLGPDPDLNRAMNRIEDLTHELEQSAWGETKPMDYTPSSNKLNTDE